MEEPDFTTSFAGGLLEPPDAWILLPFPLPPTNKSIHNEVLEKLRTYYPRHNASPKKVPTSFNNVGADKGFIIALLPHTELRS